MSPLVDFAKQVWASVLTKYEDIGVPSAINTGDMVMFAWGQYNPHVHIEVYDNRDVITFCKLPTREPMMYCHTLDNFEPPEELEAFIGGMNEQRLKLLTGFFNQPPVPLR